MKSSAGMGIDALLERLEIAYDNVPMRREKIAEKRVEKTFNPLFEQICAAYAGASVEERVDVYLAFEIRDNLLDALVIYGGNTAGNVPLLARTGKRDKATALLKQAVAAQLIVDKRGNDDLEERANMILLDAVQEADFNLERYRSQLGLTAKDFGNRALELHQQRRHVDSAKALGIALQKDHASEPDPRLADLARVLTNKPPKAAIAMLREPFQREKYILENSSRRVVKRKPQSMQLGGMDSRFWAITGAGVVGLCALALLAGFVLSTLTIPSSPAFIFIGFIIGVLLSVGFVYYRLSQAG